MLLRTCQPYQADYRQTATAAWQNIRQHPGAAPFQFWRELLRYSRPGVSTLIEEAPQ